jgi:rhomboid protease GluP
MPRPTAPAQQRPQAILHIPRVTPTVTYALLAVNIAIFTLGFFSPTFNDQLFAWGANDPAYVLRGGEYHRLLTAMFLHANPAHIFFNMLVLYSFGRDIEGIFGHVRFSLIYFLGGLAASIASVVLSAAFSPAEALNPATSVGSVGASGAIFAIIGAEYIYLYQHRKLMGEFGRQRRQSLLFIGLLNFLVGILSSVGGGPVQIDNWGHLGGLVGGLALTWYIGPIFLLERRDGSQTDFNAVDVNPLDKKYGALSLYCSVLLGVLLVAVLLSRR